MEITFDEPLVGEPDDSGRERRRGRWIAGVAAAMLIAAAGGVGYGIGRNVSTDDAGDGGGRGASCPRSHLPTVPDHRRGRRATTAIVDEFDSTSDSGVRFGGLDDLGVGRCRDGRCSGASRCRRCSNVSPTTATHCAPHLGEPWEISLGPEVDGWQPAPWCYESAQIRVALGGNGVIDVGSVPWYREPFNGRAVSVVGLGAVDGAPRWVVVAQTPPGTTGVTVTFGDGSTDTTAPQNDIAVLTVPGADAGRRSTRVGRVPRQLRRRRTTSHSTGPTAPSRSTPIRSAPGTDPEFRASCEPPPPALPDGG